MAEPSYLDPLPFHDFPEFNPSDLDPILFPDGEFPLPEGLTSDVDFGDIDLDFSVDDLLLLPPSDDNGNGSVDPQSNSNSNSNLTVNSSPVSPESGHSAASAVAANQEEGNNSWMLKRKKGDDDEEEVQNPNPDPNPDASPNFNPSSRNLKLRRSDEVTSSCTFTAGVEEDEKRKARLMRNRESAHLSRQRKKYHVEELEEKVKNMSSIIADLNGKITFYMAENARLHQQLSGSRGDNGSVSKEKTAAAAYPSPLPPPYPFPWIPYAGYPMRPNMLPVPYIPIPRLKPQQPASAVKAKSRKSEIKIKKVASVSLLGLLFIMMIFGGISKFGFGRSGDKFYGGLSEGNGRIFSVKGRDNVLNSTADYCQFSGKTGRDNLCKVNGYQKEMKRNCSETLPALLYVPRNGNHVEINGNLIIHSVLASERAISQLKLKREENKSSLKEGTGLAIPDNLASALAVPNGGTEMLRRTKAYGNSAEHPRALASDAHDTYRHNYQSTLTDGALHQWFHEGLAGPIFSSGTCSEVFQFDVSQSSAIVPASVVNATEELPGKMKNRRIMYPLPIPLTGSTVNNTKNFGKPNESSNNTFHGNSSSPSVVVSVLADPREAADGVAPNSLSRIFVVVLLDSVKYVTYSCMLPLKSHGPHLVNLSKQQ